MDKLNTGLFDIGILHRSFSLTTPIERRLDMMSLPVSSFATYVLCSQSERQISAVCDVLFPAGMKRKLSHLASVLFEIQISF